MFLNVFTSIQSVVLTTRVRRNTGTKRTANSGVSADHPSERGEGVISSAIAVLIMAVLGAAMYAAYTTLFERTTDAVTSSLEQIAQ